MPKLIRVTNKIFGQNATAIGDNPQIGQFGSAKAGTFIGTTDVETIQELPAYSNGWIDAVTPQNQFPALPEMTGVMKTMTYQTGYLYQEGIAEYDEKTSYYIGSWVKSVNSDGEYTIYESLVDDNLGNPLSDTTKWKEKQFGGTAGTYTKFAINKGNANLLNAPGSGTIEQQGTVEGWAFASDSVEQTIYRNFDAPKLLGGTFSVGTRYFPGSGSWVHIIINLVLNDNTEIEVLNRAIYGYQDVWNTDTYTFTEPKLVKSVKMYVHILGTGSFSVHDILFTEIISVSTAKTLFFNVSNEEKLTYTNIIGNSRTISLLETIDVSSISNGDYKVVLPASEFQPYLFNGQIFKQETEPSQPNANDIWINPQEPYEAKQYIDSEWINFNDTILLDSNVKIASGVITEVKQPTYNYNGIGLNQSSNTNVEYITSLGIPNYKDRRQGVTGFNIWKTVDCHCWVSALSLSSSSYRTLWLKLKDENGNEIEGAVDENAIVRCQHSSDIPNQVFAYIPKGYSYQLKIDSHQTFSQCWEFPLKGAY